MSEAKKWTSTAGPIQTKRTDDALRDIPHQRSCFVRKSGVIGVDEHSIGMMCIGKTYPRPDVDKAWTDIGERFQWTVTRENYQQIIDAVKAVMPELEANTPVEDTRETPEQHVKKEAEYKANTEIIEKRQAAKREAFINAFGNPGADLVEVEKGHCAIVLELCYDNSDILTDYFAPNCRIDSLLLRTMPGKAPRTQAAARYALLAAPDIAASGEWTWKDDCSLAGPSVELPELLRPEGKTRGHWRVTFTHWHNGPYPTAKGYTVAQPASTTGTGGAEVRRNHEHDGVEIHFPAKPDSGTIGTLKAHSWRWSMRSHCWYHRYSPEVHAWALKFVGQTPTEEPKADPAGAMVQAEEDARLDAIAEAIGA